MRREAFGQLPFQNPFDCPNDSFVGLVRQQVIALVFATPQKLEKYKYLFVGHVSPDQSPAVYAELGEVIISITVNTPLESMAAANPRTSSNLLCALDDRRLGVTNNPSDRFHLT